MRAIQKQLDNRFYAILSLPATAMGFALSVQIAALSWVLNTQFGFDAHQVGIVWLAGPLAGIFGQVIIGFISDKVWFWNGRRRPFILIGGTIAAVMLLALPNIGGISKLLGTGSIIGVAITVALTLDLAINISFNPTRSIIADVTPVGDPRTKGYTWMQTISGFFGVAAYVIGAYIGNYELIYIGAVLVFVFSVFPTLMIEEPRQMQEEETMPPAIAELAEGALDAVVIEEDNSGNFRNTQTDWAGFMKICLAHSFTWLGVQTMFVYTFFYIKQSILGHDAEATLDGAQSSQIGFIIGNSFAILNTVGFLLPAPVLAPLAKKIGRVRTHRYCIWMMALGYAAVVMLPPGFLNLALLMCVIGVGWAATVSLPFAIMSEVVDQRRMGWFMGLFNLSVVLPQIGASLLGGFIAAQPDKAVIFIISAVALSISGILWSLVKESSGNASTAGAMSAGH